MIIVVLDGCPGHDDARAAAPSLIDEIVREGARRMLAEVLRAEVDAYIAAAVAERDANDVWWSATGITSRGRC